MLRALRLSSLFLLLALFGAVPLRAAEDGILRVGLEDFYPPFAMEDEAGQHTGFDQEIAEALCQDMQRSCRFEIMTFGDLVKATANGELDFFVAGLRFRPELEKTIAFSERYFRCRSVYIGRKDKVSISAEGLAGKKLGAQVGTTHEEHIVNMWKDAATIVSAPYQEIVSRLLAGEIDAALVDGLAGYYLLQSEGGSELDLLADPMPVDSSTNYAHIGVRKNAPQLLKQINKSLHNIRMNGEYHRINSKYFPFNIY